MSTKTSRTALWSVLIAVAFVACSKRAPEPREPFAIERSNVATGQATVVKINMKDRHVTLRGEDGREFTIVAGEEVRNLKQVKVGDVVVVTYYEAIAAEMRPPTDDEKANPATVVQAAERAPLGDKPGMVGGQSVRLVGTVTSIDMTTLRATIKDTDGVVHTVQGRDPNNVKRFKVGDPVVLTYTEALAIAVEPAPASSSTRKSKR